MAGGQQQTGDLQPAGCLKLCTCGEGDGWIGILLPGGLVLQGGGGEGSAAGAGLGLLAGAVCPHDHGHCLWPPEDTALSPQKAWQMRHAHYLSWDCGAERL